MKNIVKIFFLGLIFILHNNFYAQSLKLDWGLGIRDSVGMSSLFIGAETLSITTDDFGNVYSLGILGGNALEFSPISSYSIPNSNSISFFILKQDNSGNIIWIRFMETSGTNARPKNITTDVNNNLIIIGNLIGTIDFDPGVGVMYVSSNGSSDIFILKLDNNGDFIWVKTIGGQNVDEGVGVVTDLSGNIYASGNFVGIVDFDPGVGTYNLASQSSSQRDVFALKLTSNGDFVWAKAVGTSNGSDYAKNIGLDSNNNVIFGGNFTGSGDFNPGPGVTTLSSGNFAQVFFVKLDSSGTFIWAKATQPKVGIDGVAVCENFTTSIEGDIYFAGTYGGNMDFNPANNATTSIATPAVNSRRGYIAKWNSLGNFVFVKHFVGSFNSFTPNSLDLDSLKNIYITGVFKNTIDFYPGNGVYNVTSKGDFDIFILKLNSNGEFILTRNFGKSGSPYINKGNSIKLDNLDNIYLSGLYRDTMDFDPGVNTFNLIATPNSPGAFTNAGFSLKLAPCIQTTDTMNINACNPYIAPSGAVLTASGTYQDIILNATGCDSIITINYTDNNSLTFLTIDRCASYTVPSGTTTYTASGTYTVYDTLSNSLGCDSILNILLSINDNYHAGVVLACDSFMMPSMTQWYYTSGIYYDTVPNIQGCREFFADTVFVSPTTFGTNSMIGCGSVTSLSGNQVWTSSGTYQDTISNANFCDSIITTNVTINNHSYDTITPIACYKYTSPIGSTYYNSGTYTNVLQNTIGCDSVITINLTILQPTSGGSDSISVICPNYVSNTGNQIWTTSGTYTDTLYNANSVGCDSSYTVYLTVQAPSVIPWVPIVFCNSSFFVSYSGNQIWTTTGLFLDTVPILNQYGCDSIIYVNLISPTSYSSITEDFCSSVNYTSPAGNIYTSTGVYYDTLVNYLGCDSIIEIKLNIIEEAQVTPLGNNLQIEFFGVPPNHSRELQVIFCDNQPWLYNPWYYVGNPEPLIYLNSTGTYEFRYKISRNSNLICFKSVQCYDYGTIGVSEYDISNNIDVYPNPTDGIVNIDLGKHYSEISVNLNDIVGRNILNKTLQNMTLFDLNIENLPKGIYFMHLLADDKSAIVKIVKN